MVFAEFEYDMWPIVIINFYEKPRDDTEFDECMEEMIAVLNCASQKNSKCNLVFNFSEVSENPGMTYAAKMANILKENKPVVNTGLASSSIVGPKWLGGVLKMVFTIHPPVKPWKHSSKMYKGLKFANEKKEMTDIMIDKDDILDLIISVKTV